MSLSNRLNRMRATIRKARGPCNSMQWREEKYPIGLNEKVAHRPLDNVTEVNRERDILQTHFGGLGISRV